MPWPKTGLNHYHAQLDFQTKVVQSKGWFFFKGDNHKAIVVKEIHQNKIPSSKGYLLRERERGDNGLFITLVPKVLS